MLKRTRKKCRRFNNMHVEQADITKLPYRDQSFDKVVAANVIHLLNDPRAALDELFRVCKPGGKIIIPTYINYEKEGTPSIFVKVVGKLGADFKNQFTYQSYKEFFRDKGYRCRFEIIRGSMPCAIAVILRGSVRYFRRILNEYNSKVIEPGHKDVGDKEKVFPGNTVPKVEYSLTELGYSLMPVMDALCRWGHEHIPDGWEMK